jgi:septum formation protein
VSRPDRPPLRLVLGSRSPRRLELLRQIHPAELIDVVPPSTTDEAGFAGLHDWPAIERRLLEIATLKCEDVAAQIRNNLGSRARFSGGGSQSPVVIAADTVVIVDRGGELHVLGQPPDEASWQETVRRWFLEDFGGKTHLVATALVLEAVDTGNRMSRVVTSRVTFTEDVDRWLDWYLATDESRGKAGGYALQGAGSVFVSKVEGSLSNVVGLPLAELLELLGEIRMTKHE